jgi:hypothetical protein
MHWKARELSLVAQPSPKFCLDEIYIFRRCKHSLDQIFHLCILLIPLWSSMHTLRIGYNNSFLLLPRLLCRDLFQNGQRHSLPNFYPAVVLPVFLFL